jgi:hypothetical protein
MNREQDTTNLGKKRDWSSDWKDLQTRVHLSADTPFVLSTNNEAKSRKNHKGLYLILTGIEGYKNNLQYF